MKKTFFRLFYWMVTLIFNVISLSILNILACYTGLIYLGIDYRSTMQLIGIIFEMIIIYGSTPAREFLIEMLEILFDPDF